MNHLSLSDINISMSEALSTTEKTNEQRILEIRDRLREISARPIADNADVSNQVGYVEQFLEGNTDELNLALPSEKGDMTDNWLFNLLTAVEELTDVEAQPVLEKRVGWEASPRGHLYSLTQQTIIEGVVLKHSFGNDGKYSVSLIRKKN